MTNPETPAQGGATEEQIEACDIRGALYRGLGGMVAAGIPPHIMDRAVAEITAALSASASADPADDHHDAEQCDIAGQIEAERLDADPDALGADAYINGLRRAEEIVRAGR